jgi:uncharacterized membrane protein (DUF485 family)
MTTSPNSLDWERIAQSPEFRALMKRKRRFIVWSVAFFTVYYFALPVLTGYFRFLNTPVFGAMNYAYLIALSQFLMAWVLAFLYIRHANQTDRLIEEIVRKREEKAS